LLRNSVDASQAETIGAIDALSVKMRQREQQAQTTFDHTLTDISRKVLLIAVIFLGVIVTAGIVIALHGTCGRGVPQECHRQTPGRRRPARLEGEGGSRTDRAQ
jgi:hypothetical protein